ncbi:TPA: HNH endonuclease [Klebsiella pneumoniae]
MATDKNMMDKLPRDIKDKVLVRPVGGSEAYEEFNSVHQFMQTKGTGTNADARQFRLAVKRKGIAIWPDDDPRVTTPHARDGIRWEVRLKVLRAEHYSSLSEVLDETVSAKRYGNRYYGSASRPDQMKFSNTVRQNCLNRCVVTGVRTKCRGEAAHLIEHCKAGFDHWSNGLWLRADIHRLFDAGMCAVDPETLRIHFSPDVLKEDKDLSELEGKQLLPTKKPVNTDYLVPRWEVFCQKW